MTNLDSVLKSRDITLPKKCTHNQSYGFSSSHMVSTVALEKIPESPLDLKEIKPVNLKGNQL